MPTKRILSQLDRPGDENYGKILATYKSHFFDPETGLNWLGEDSPTAVTEGPKFFKMALDEYNNGNIHAAGYFWVFRFTTLRT